ncbi:MAG: hypothetical protein ACM3PW_04500 [Chlamydiota bacterium]
MKTIFAVSLIALSSLLARAQAAPSYTIKSWKTGTAHAEPQTLHVALSTADRTYRKVINDAGGRPLYRLLVEPVAFIGPGDGIVAWHVYLTTVDSNQNLLLPSNSLEQEEYERPDYLWWFYPGKNLFAPIDAPRVVQLQGSYVRLQAEDVKVNGSGQLEGMQLTITFSNTPPQPANAPSK